VRDPQLPRRGETGPHARTRDASSLNLPAAVSIGSTHRNAWISGNFCCAVPIRDAIGRAIDGSAAAESRGGTGMIERGSAISLVKTSRESARGSALSHGTKCHRQMPGYGLEDGFISQL
jgi:hypothetical protein